MKKALSFFIALFICFSTISSNLVLASNSYETDDSDDDGGATFYLVEDGDETVDDLFDLTLYNFDSENDDGTGSSILSWIFNFRTFTVIKEYEDSDSNLLYRVYFNTPNLQMLARNTLISAIADGYTDTTYDVNETQWIVPVGNNASNRNVITQYGFNVPSYTYMGEYPKVSMSIAGIVPTTWYETLWSAIKAVFGVSFINAPTSNNFNTITYNNHGYNDPDDFIVEFFQRYYIPYFADKIEDRTNTSNYFSSPAEVSSSTVTQQQNDSADQWIQSNQEQIDFVSNKFEKWDLYNNNRNSVAYTLSYCNMSIVGSPLLVYNVAVESMESPECLHDMRESGGNLPIADFASTNPDFVEDFSNWVMMNTQNRWFLYACVMCQGGAYASELGLSGITPNSSQSELSNAFSNIVADQELLRKLLICVVDADQLHNDIGTSNMYALEHYVYSELTPAEPGHTELQASSEGGYHMELVEVDAVEATYGWVFDAEGTVTRMDEVYISDVNVTEGDLSTDGYSEGDEIWVAHSIDYVTETLNSSFTTSHNYFYFDGDPTGTTVNDVFWGRVIYDFFNGSRVYPGTYDWQKDAWLTNGEMIFWQEYLEKQQIMADYEAFITTMMLDDPYELDEENGIEFIPYRQCLIPIDETDEEADGTCTSNKYGTGDTNLSVANIYVYTRVYTISWGKTYLTESEVQQIIQKIRDYAGPYATDVLQNMIKIMCLTALYDGDTEPYEFLQTDDLRVMPFDTETLTLSDQENYAVTDPRVDLYKSHLIGSLVSFLRLDGTIFLYFLPQKWIINLTGRISELSVFLNQLMSFDVLDSYGLSPTRLWNNGFLMFIMGCLALFFIVKTVIIVFKSGNTTQVLLAFLTLLAELGFCTALLMNPQGIWTKVKSIEHSLIYMGESTFMLGVNNLEYLYGDATDYEVTYYMPYLDAWSTFNTGYGIMDSYQLISEDDIEMEGMGTYPTVGSSNIQHYSVLLMDAFSYYGHSDGINSVNINNVLYNGTKINNNAYRVVDHFMAPRVHLDKSGDSITMTVTENENYNGMFQKGFLNLIVKMLTALLLCFISVIKLMTFFYLWFNIYTFVFKVVLGRSAENKTWWELIKLIAIPTLELIIIGLFAGVFMRMGLTLDGLFGIILVIGIGYTTVLLIRWWHNYKNGEYFPPTLKWVYFLTNLSDYRRQRSRQQESEKARLTAMQNGINVEDKNAFDTLSGETSIYFDENANLLPDFVGLSPKDVKMNSLTHWYKRALGHQKYYGLTDTYILNCMTTFEGEYTQIADECKHLINGMDNSELEKIL